MSDSFTYVNPVSASNDYNRFQFAFRRAIARVRTVQIAEVIKCTNDGDLSPAGTVDVQLMLNMTDQAGNTNPLPIVYGVPYSRIQGGKNAVIMDPEKGDIGIVGFGDRDLSTIIATKAQAAPGSNRRFSMADAIWIGGLLNGEPEQYVQFSSAGIKFASPNAVLIQAPKTTIDGDLEVTGESKLDGAVTADSTITASGEVEGNGIKLSTHKHTGVQTGGGTSGAPTN